MKFLAAKNAAAMAGISVRTLYSEVSAGRFPKPVQLTSRRVGWVEDEIDNWMVAKIRARDEAALS